MHISCTLDSLPFPQPPEPLHLFTKLIYGRPHTPSALSDLCHPDLHKYTRLGRQAFATPGFPMCP